MSVPRTIPRLTFVAPTPSPAPRAPPPVHPYLQTLTPERGYSAARFVPGTGDRVLLAVKSVELAAARMQTSFLSVITIDGQELLQETELPGNIKCAVCWALPTTRCIVFKSCWPDGGRWSSRSVSTCLCLCMRRFEGLEFI